MQPVQGRRDGVQARLCIHTPPSPPSHRSLSLTHTHTPPHAPPSPSHTPTHTHTSTNASTHTHFISAVLLPPSVHPFRPLPYKDMDRMFVLDNQFYQISLSQSHK